MSEETGVWIRSKVVLFLGINNQLAGAFMVDSQYELDIMKELAFDFPYMTMVYDELPRISDCVDFKITDELITTHVKLNEHVTKPFQKKRTDVSQEIFDKMQKTFGITDIND